MIETAFCAGAGVVVASSKTYVAGRGVSLLLASRKDRLLRLASSGAKAMPARGKNERLKAIVTQ